MRQIDPNRTDLALEFKNSPLGPHGDELQKVLNIMRWAPLERKTVVVRRNRQWLIGTINTARAAPVDIDETTSFPDQGAAFWHIFQLRWKAHTGEYPNVD